MHIKINPYCPSNSPTKISTISPIITNIYIFRNEFLFKVKAVISAIK